MYNDYLINTYNRMDFIAESGNGCWLTDVNGNTYLDLVAGVAVNSLGHSHPAVVKSIQAQAEKMIHVSNIFWTKEQGELAKKLVELSNHQGVFFCNSGSEAVEGAIKTAIKYGTSKKAEKEKIICFNNSFHGRTIGALSITAQEKYQQPFGSLLKKVKICHFNDLEDVKANMDEDVCAIIVEPVQGEGGIQVATTAFLEGLKMLCEENDSLLIFDEIQCGAGRLGTFFAYEKYGVEPDIICMAKGLGGGVPIGAFIVNEKANVLIKGDHGSTFGGNPFVCAVSKTVIDITGSPDFLETVNEKSAYLKEALFKIEKKYPQFITEVRGEGLMLGIEMKVPVKEVIQEAYKNKVLLISAGSNVIRIVPPLTIEYKEMDVFIDTFNQILETF
ncbi:MAG: aspartate aminotransferase family protein [Clostridia bacterium]|nr:aspartate aminotransferase family protein [Clostridia bacterium]